MGQTKNPTDTLATTPDLSGWDSCRTAVLVIHGVGDQEPLETIDDFGRPLLDVLRSDGSSLELAHRLVAKTSSPPGVWFDNVLRVRRAGAPEGRHLDLYEYYWADQTENQVGLAEVQQWIGQVARSARKFYRENEVLALRQEGTQGLFVRRGRFLARKYQWFLTVVGVVLPTVRGISRALLTVAGGIPGVGGLFRGLLSRWFSGAQEFFLLLISGIVVYSSSDRRARYRHVRQKILQGAVEAIQYLFEADALGHRYDRVLLVGHSLGTQVAYDGVNRLVHAVTEGLVPGWDPEGRSTRVPGLTLDQVFQGFVTLGSPLDKIAFFLRAQVAPEAYLRLQMANHYHSFKQRDWSPEDAPGPRVAPPFRRWLDDVPWRNYYDVHDPIGGPLDFYLGLTNVDAQLPPQWFTHNEYWNHRPLYVDIVTHFLR